MKILSNAIDVSRNSARGRSGFSLADLLVMIAIVAILAALLLPALAKSKTKAQGIMCLNNKKQLMLAWIMYADDNGGKLAGNYQGAVTQGPNPTSNNWAAGWLDWSLRADNTNSLFLTDSRWSRLGSYLGQNKAVFRCPADAFVSRTQSGAGWKERVRSVAMNACMGPGNDKEPEVVPGRIFTKLADLTTPSPTAAWVLIDEHPDSIDDGCFFVNAARPEWRALPASYHNGACGLGFADGHSEIHKWRNLDAATGKVRFEPYRNDGYPRVSARTDDYTWLKDRTSEYK